MMLNNVSSSDLPPLRNLPSWSRVRGLDGARYPRLLSSDRELRGSPSGTDAHGRRVANLEKDIEFLQKQHEDTLQRLHTELEQLKRLNKELQYQLIMQRCHPTREFRSDSSNSSSRSPQVHQFTSPDPHASRLKECELLIHQLHHINTAQGQQLQRFKSFLSDVVLHQKKPNVQLFSLTQAFLQDISREEVNARLLASPQAALQKQNTSPVDADRLPAISRGVRTRKAPDLHRTRLRRSLIS